MKFIITDKIPVTYNDKTYYTGEEITLSRQEAEPLLEKGYIKKSADELDDIPNSFTITP